MPCCILTESGSAKDYRLCVRPLDGLAALKRRLGAYSAFGPLRKPLARLSVCTVYCTVLYLYCAQTHMCLWAILSSLNGMGYDNLQLASLCLFNENLTEYIILVKHSSNLTKMNIWNYIYIWCVYVFFWCHSYFKAESIISVPMCLFVGRRCIMRKKTMCWVENGK